MLQNPFVAFTQSMLLYRGCASYTTFVLYIDVSVD
jgi:hypothetical protein